MRTINVLLTLTETVTAPGLGTIFTQYVGSVIFQLQSSQNWFQISAQLLHPPPPQQNHTSPHETIRLHANAVLFRSAVPPEAQTLAFDNKISSQLSSFLIFTSFTLSSRLLSCSGPSVPHIIISENTNTTAQMVTAASFHWMNS